MYQPTELTRINNKDFDQPYNLFLKQFLNVRNNSRINDLAINFSP